MGLGAVRRYVAKLTIDNEIYYQTEYDNYHNNAGYLIKGSGLIGFEPFAAVKQLRLTRDINRTNPITGEYYDTLKAGSVIEFAESIRVNNQLYYRTKHNATYGLYFALPADATAEI